MLLKQISMSGYLIYLFFFMPIYRPLITLNREIMHLEYEDATDLFKFRGVEKFSRFYWRRAQYEFSKIDAVSKTNRPVFRLPLVINYLLYHFRVDLLSKNLIKIPKVTLFISIFNPFSTNSPFYKLWKHEKTSGFLMFSGGIDVEHWFRMG